MARNLVVYYQYRDAGNYKSHGQVVLENPTQINPAVLKVALASAFPEHQYFPDIVGFDPVALGWPGLSFEPHDCVDGDDLPNHEIEAIEPTDAPASESGGVAALLERLRLLRIPAPNGGC